MERQLRKSRVLPDKLAAFVTPDNPGNPNQLFVMFHRLILKVTKFQLPPPKRLSTVVENIFGRASCLPPCQIGLSCQESK